MSSSSDPPSSSGSKKRLLNELKSLHSSPLPSFLSSIGPVSDAQILVWEAVMSGPVGGAYHGMSCVVPFAFEDWCQCAGADVAGGLRDVLGGRWKLDISIPDTYPLHPPIIKFKTPVCHPNIHFKVNPLLSPSLYNLQPPTAPPSPLLSKKIYIY